MRRKIKLHHLFVIALSSIAFSPLAVYAQYDAPQPSGGPVFSIPSGKPSANNEIFKKLKAQCETEVTCGKANGDICADAAAILTGNDPPDDLRGLPESQRFKIALRLLEKGIDSSNLAAGRAYDLYSKSDLFLGMTTAGYSDSYRANELMELMTRRSYPGAALRNARATVSILNITMPDTAKKQSCELATRLKAEGKLDVDSVKIADQVLDAAVCKPQNQGQGQAN